MDGTDAFRAKYFAEKDPEVRLGLLESSGDKEPEAAFLAGLYKERYSDPRNPERKVDNWLWKFVYLPGLYKKRNISKSAFQKEAGLTIKELHLDENLTGEQRELLYLEFRNAAHRYLSTCNGDRYGSRLFGLKKATPEEKKEKAAEELWMMSRGIALATGKTVSMGLFQKALFDELEDYFPGFRTVCDRLEQQFFK